MKRGTWLAATGLLLAVAAKGAVSVEDPYLWLEDVHGAKPLAWVAEQNARTRAALQADPRYVRDHDAVLKVLDATDRIPYGSIVHDTVFNFWQDAANPKGVWRRTTLADYTSSSPHWEAIIDVDKLAADEHENWIWEGANCTDDLKRCLVLLSRDGGDAHVIREYDLGAKAFVKDGFALPHAKSDASWLDDDTVLFDTDFGAGTLTKSGYPRIVKIWHRGESIAAAKTLLEGKPEDIAVSTQTLNGAAGTYAMIVRGVSFFENEYHHVAADGTLTRIDLPLSAVIQGMVGDRLVFTLRKEWDTRAKTYPQGALLTMKTDGSDVEVLYAPGPRSTIEEVATGRDAIYASIFDNVTGSIHTFRRLPGGAWNDAKLDLPANGSTHIVAANDFGPEAMFTFESYLKPSTLYLDKGDGKPAAIKALPPRFDSSGLVTEAVPGRLDRRRDDPLFRDAAEDGKRAGADRALRLWRLRGLADAGLFGEFRHAVAEPWRQSTSWRTSAAAASSGRPGTKRRASRTTRRRSTISPRWRAIWSSAASPRPSSSASSAARMAGFWFRPRWSSIPNCSAR